MNRRVLIVCTGNSCRSQMAEGFLRHFGNGAIDVFSAGTHPSIVHPLAIRAMNEVGIDISHHRSKSVDEFVGDKFDVVVTVCDNAKETCPVFPSTHRTIHMPFDDPVMYPGSEEERMQHYRRVRDEIREAMEKFVREVVGT